VGMMDVLAGVYKRGKAMPGGGWMGRLFYTKHTSELLNWFTCCGCFGAVHTISYVLPLVALPNGVMHGTIYT